INKQEALIAQKQGLKKGLKQQLLSGNKRLVGFTAKWVILKLKEIAADKGIVRGPFGGALKKKFFVKQGFKVNYPKNANYQNVELGEYYVTEEKYNDMIRFSVDVGDLIISYSGTIGKIYKIPENHPKAIINQALLKLTCNPEVADTDFFISQ